MVINVESVHTFRPNNIIRCDEMAQWKAVGAAENKVRRVMLLGQSLYKG